MSISYKWDVRREAISFLLPFNGGELAWHLDLPHFPTAPGRVCLPFKQSPSQSLLVSSEKDHLIQAGSPPNLLPLRESVVKDPRNELLLRPNQIHLTP